MTDKTKGVKHPRQLAINETSSRRQLDQLDLFGNENEEEHPSVTEFKKSLYTMSEAEAIIYDSLCLACTEFHDKQWQDDKTGEWHDIIGRKTDITESHYRFFAPENVTKYILVGPYENEWPNVRNQLMKLALNPVLKKLIIDKKHYIIDVPIRITPWYETDDIEKFTNLSPRRKGKGKGDTGKTAREATGVRETGKAKGRIIGWSIEFFKPLFESLLLLNAKRRKSTGQTYFLTPPYFQLKLNAMYKSLNSSTTEEQTRPTTLIDAIENKKMSLFPQNKAQIKAEADFYRQKLITYKNYQRNLLETVTPLQIRYFYTFLCLSDNHHGDYITIKDLVEFVDGLWPKLVRTDRNGNNVLQPKEYNQVLDRINLMLKVYFPYLVGKGDMNGGQLVPLTIIEGEELTRETNKMRIQCIKQKTMYSTYSLENTAKFLLNLSPPE